MLWGSSFVLTVGACRDARPVPDRDGFWEIVGPDPQFELQIAERKLPLSWAIVSFDLTAEGRSTTDCILEVQTPSNWQRVDLGKDGRRRAIIRLLQDVRSVRVLLGKEAGTVSISPVEVRPISKAEAGVRMVARFFRARMKSWRHIKSGARTALKLFRAGGPREVVGRIIHWQLYAGIRSEESAPPVALNLNDAQRYERWIIENESRELAAPAPERPELMAVLVLASASSLSALGRTVASLQAQTQGGWQAILAISEPVPHAGSAGGAISKDARISSLPLRQAVDAIVRTKAEFIAILEAGDVLAPRAFEEIGRLQGADADAEIIYSDEDVIGAGGRRSQPLFKPEWSPELLAAFNYFGRLTAIRRQLVQDVGGLAADLGPASTWDLNLRASEKAKGIRRITQVLAHRDAESGRDLPAPSNSQSALYREAIARHWTRQGITARIETQNDGTQRSTWDIAEPPLVSVIIPNKNKPELLKVCLDGLLRRTDYPRIEIIIVDNLSTDPALAALYRDLQASGQARIVSFNERFNYSAACNAGARAARGDLLLFLNNDIEVIAGDWLNELVRFALRPGVGVVGTMLVFPNGAIQHAGVIAGPHLCALMFREVPPDAWGPFCSPSVPRNYLAIMGACQLVRRETYDRVGGFDESYRISNSDVAISVRAYRAGYRTAYTPFARLVHHEGKTRGHSNPEEDLQRTAQDLRVHGIADDPYFHPSLSLLWVGKPAVRVLPEPSSRQILQENTSRLLGGFSTPTEFDLFDDAAAMDLTGMERSKLLWAPQPAATVGDIWSAARFCIDLLRTRPDLRQRFPKALSAGRSGAFAEWLTTEGRRLFELSPATCHAMHSVFDAGPAEYVRRYYLFREDLRTAFPLALTPAGRREFFWWVFRNGLSLPGIRLETIWWFFLESAEDPAAELVRTYLFTPRWQALFPDGLTVFGGSKLSAWLKRFYRIDFDWVYPGVWPTVGSPAQHLRLAYAQREYWQREHPHAFATLEAARDFIDWLFTPAAGLSAEAMTWCKGLNREAVAQQLSDNGVNILGHFCYPSGLRTSVESMLEGLKRAGADVSLRDIWAGERDDPQHSRFDGLEIYDTTIIHAQPEPFFDVAYQRSGLQPRAPKTYRIGYWYWELESIPSSWKDQAAQVDELWAATRFVAEALKNEFSLPVFQMMPGVELPKFEPKPRSHFGLNQNRFTFLFVFHMMSIMERKNPLGLIKAYRSAFADDPSVALVLKTSFGGHHPKLMQELRDAATDGGITIIDDIYSQDETLSLMAACDCYVSLHRSEGFGLTMAEAMLLGKPTIATGYSGNVDFMDAGNSLLVDYDLVKLERDYPPYKAGSRWAEPRVDHAALLMRQVYENQSWARDLGGRAKADLNKRMSLQASGLRMAARLAEIRAAQEATATKESARPIVVQAAAE